MGFVCAMTGREYPEFSDGIWDDDEWISWDYINGYIHDQEVLQELPHSDEETRELFANLVSDAAEYKALTGRYLPIWGELGEFYAELKYGIARHRPHAQGSDGRLGNDFVEVKTISPDKKEHRVEVKLSGNFSQLVIVKIDKDFNFESKMIARSDLKRPGAGKAKVRWEQPSPAAKPNES